MSQPSADPLRSPWSWAIPALALLLLALLGLANLNQPLFLWLNHALYLPAEGLWLNVTLFGDAGMMAILLLPLIGKRPDIIWSALLAGILTAILVDVGKDFFAFQRPPNVLAAETFHQLGNRFGAASFPSGHTAAAFSVAGTISLMVTDTRIRLAVIALALFIALSRIAVGAHWPMDITAGAFTGWLAAIFGVWLGRHLPANRGVQIFCALLLVTTVIYLVFIHKNGDAEARLLEITVPLLSLALALPGLRRLFFPGARHAA